MTSALGMEPKRFTTGLGIGVGDRKRKLLERDDPGLKAVLTAEVWKWEVRDEVLGGTGSCPCPVN